MASLTPWEAWLAASAAVASAKEQCALAGHAVQPHLALGGPDVCCRECAQAAIRKALARYDGQPWTPKRKAEILEFARAFVSLVAAAPPA